MVKLDNERGSICISSEVFTWLAGDAATRCFGVKGMAGRSKEGGPWPDAPRKAVWSSSSVGSL